MSDVQDQIERKLAESDAPAGDATAEEPMVSDPHPDRTREGASPGFSRMRSGWAGDDYRKVMELEALSERIVRERFSVAFAVRDRIWRSVRRQAYEKSSGAYLTYDDGTPQWEKDEYGDVAEDWGLLSDTVRSGLMMTIATHMFEWELVKAGMWAEAMYAKGQWEDIFSRGFTSLPGHVVSGKPTIEDRTHHAQKNAAEARYFALFQSALSRKADAVVKSMTALAKVLESTRAW